MPRKMAADREAVRQKAEEYRNDLAKLFDLGVMRTRRSVRSQAKQFAQKQTGFGIAEILMFVQVIMAIWSAWERYKKANPSFAALTNVAADPQFDDTITQAADEESGP